MTDGTELAIMLGAADADKLRAALLAREAQAMGVAPTIDPANAEDPDIG